jgi:hypothetical protein
MQNKFGSSDEARFKAAMVAQFRRWLRAGIVDVHESVLALSGEFDTNE